MLEKLLSIRKKNLKRLIEENYEGNYQQVADIVGKTKDTLQKYYQPNSRLKISSKVARNLEDLLQLPPNYLDKANDDEKSIYYVMVFVKDSETYNIVEWLYRNAPEVKDCSTLLGEFDIILKIEVPNFHYLERFFSKLKRIPNVMRTQTFASVDSLRWQREQMAYTNIEDPLTEKSFADYYKNKRISELAQRIRDIEGGEIVAYENAQEKISLLEMMRWTKKSFFSVREYKEKIDQYEDYFNEEKNKVKQGISSKRIFTLPKSILSRQEELAMVMQEAKDLLDVDVDVRFVFEDNWISYKKIECFAIVDESFVYIRGDSGDKSRLKERNQDVKSYQILFDKNWEIGWGYDKFNKRYVGRYLDEVLTYPP